MHPAVLRTLAYADIFDYPLSLKEINHWLISKTPRTILTLKPSSQFRSKDNFYFLTGRQHLVALRQKRYAFSQKKLKIARKVGEWLRLIPTIKMVAITGALAMNNADKYDDIDLLIITRQHRLWLTRLFLVSIMEILRIRRQPDKTIHQSSIINLPAGKAGHQSIHANKICLNLWLDETSLNLPKQQRNLYTAHEVAQVKPLWDRGDTYQKFLSANSWVKDFLPNVKISQAQCPNPKQQERNLCPQASALGDLLEKIAFRTQYLYMKPKITREKVSLHFAFFHPKNMQREVTNQYQSRMKKLGISS